jgi:hypothetical protein
LEELSTLFEDQSDIQIMGVEKLEEGSSTSKDGSVAVLKL